MTRTIYKVGDTSGEPSPNSSTPDFDLLQPEPASDFGASASGSRLTRRKFLWVIAVIAILTIAMIVAIAVLGAAESPAVGTNIDPGTPSSVAAVVNSTEPMGTSTTMAPVTTAPSTGATALTHVIADPVRLVIPALEVDATVTSVGLKNGDEMEIPEVGLVGWYKHGPAPGAAGPSVLVSHVSYNGEKGVFYKLKDLKQGDQFSVYDASGDYAVFQVDSCETILKTKLPTERIWNETEESVIRLVTCGGEYDSKSRHYLSNVIVYGHLVK